MPEKLKNIVSNLQQLPDNKKKIVFFTIMAVIVLLAVVVGVVLTKNNINAVGESLRGMELPKIEIPNRDDDFMPSFNINDLEEIDKAFKEADDSNTFDNNVEAVNSTSMENNQTFETQY